MCNSDAGLDQHDPPVAPSDTAEPGLACVPDSEARVQPSGRGCRHGGAGHGPRLSLSSKLVLAPLPSVGFLHYGADRISRDPLSGPKSRVDRDTYVGRQLFVRPRHHQRRRDPPGMTLSMHLSRRTRCVSLPARETSHYPGCPAICTRRILCLRPRSRPQSRPIASEHPRRRDPHCPLSPLQDDDLNERMTMDALHAMLAGPKFYGEWSPAMWITFGVITVVALVAGIIITRL